ncbi:L-arabinose transport system permease protein AraQ [Paraliobacillus sp. PM-2]|uniref:carbohydrate ABC transporter permease n=1 Tax=Paraliobacillus sp. PM-2 TaxID=1462524 RepID=UPI00061BA6BD|nr:carbohydrate ABC transporter permease [Paraliobacillus sp. PM-2]CQR46459.1 L-arabinose transport system permease protein AraQ [Paraliobacillus sp. PM-2]
MGKKILFYITITIILLLFVVPYLWMFLTSFKTIPEVMSYPPKFLPGSLNLDNFIQILEGSIIPRSLLNSLIVATVGASLNVIFGSLAAFAFARLEFPGRDILFKIVLGTMMIPAGLLVVPLFSMMKNVPFFGPDGLLDTYPALILPGAVTGFGIFLIRQYLYSIPKELDEQARIDGCNKFQIYFKIILPLCKPAIVLVFIFSFLNHWNEYLWHLTAVNSEKMFTLQIALKTFQTQYSINWPLIMAGASVAAMPMILLYFFLSDTFEKGLGGVGTGTKG